MNNLYDYQSKSGNLVPVFTIEVQTIPGNTDRIIDEVMKVNPMRFGRYQRNASISAVGMETSQPEQGTTTSSHVDGFHPGTTETYPMVELKFSIERDVVELAKVMEAIIVTQHYEEPVILVRECWASRTRYNPDNKIQTDGGILNAVCQIKLNDMVAP